MCANKNNADKFYCRKSMPMVDEKLTIKGLIWYRLDILYLHGRMERYSYLMSVPLVFPAPNAKCKYPMEYNLHCCHLESEWRQRSEQSPIAGGKRRGGEGGKGFSRQPAMVKIKWESSSKCNLL